ncbi:MAG: DUF5916 domain-containing protein [Gammaproteobacteria bacterium]
MEVIRTIPATSRRTAKLVITALMLVLTSANLLAQSNTYQIPRINGAPDIDGDASDVLWSQAERIPVNIEVDPGDSVPAEVQAHALVMENGETLFVAFIAEDPDPDQIRAFYQDRDRAWNDDFMGIILDTFNDERRASEFFVNPLGVQMDATFDDVNNREDESWNAIWDSVGQITESGYTVELAIPLKQLRFNASSEDQVWGIDVTRHYPRNRRTRMRSQVMDRDIDCYLCKISKIEGFAGLEQSRNLEIVPTLTSTRIESRDPAVGEWQGGDFDFEPSLDVRWGITQDMYFNGTLNPDFSQVEADSPQLDINNTFSLFFPERRTFFLDGADYFDSRKNLVYTRNIADPDYGLKLTGKTGDHTYALLAADDVQTNFIVPGNLSSRIASLDNTSSEISIARYRYDIFSTSSIGTTITDRRGDGYNNSVVSVDAVLRPTTADTFYLQSMHSSSDNPLQIQNKFDQAASMSDNSHIVNYRHNDRNWDVAVDYEDWGTDFRADLGFINRVGYKFFLTTVGHTWRWDSDSFLTRFRFAADYDRTEDQNGLLLEEEVEYFINANGPMQSFFNVLIGGADVYWNGQYFEEQFNNFTAGFSPTQNLFMFIHYRVEDVVDFANTRLGKSEQIAPEISYRWNRHFQTAFEMRRQEFDVEGGRLFNATLGEVRTTYQFDNRSFIRFTAQYSHTERNPDLYLNPVQSLSKSLTTQLLYSYKLNAVTRFFVGYSDAGFRNDSYSSIEPTNRTFFAKFSYAWQP